MNINWTRRGYTEEDFVRYWYLSDSFDILARNLGYSYYHSTKSKFKEMGEELGLTFDHFNTAPRQSASRQTVEKYLVCHGDREIRSATLKKLLFKYRYFEKICDRCDRTEWMGQPIPLELDHINGDNRDNRLENLRILCRNCHGQTDTFAMVKNTNKAKEPHKAVLCLYCNEPCRFDAYWHTRCLQCSEEGCFVHITDRSVYCKAHYIKYKKPSKPRTKIVTTNIDLKRRVDSGETVIQIAESFGCHPNAIYARLKKIDSS